VISLTRGTESDSCVVVIRSRAADSKRRSDHDVAVGRATSRACSPVRDLLLCAKHLFSAARGALRTGEPPKGERVGAWPALPVRA
jgi:hypothetical protein